MKRLGWIKKSVIVGIHGLLVFPAHGQNEAELDELSLDENASSLPANMSPSEESPNANESLAPPENGQAFNPAALPDSPLEGSGSLTKESSETFDNEKYESEKMARNKTNLGNSVASPEAAVPPIDLPKNDAVNALAPPVNALAPPVNALAPPVNALAPPVNALAPPVNGANQAATNSPDLSDAAESVETADSQSSELEIFRERAKQLRALEPGEGPQEYVIQPGDTLWDLADQFVDDPFWWPKLWSLNPTIQDPNVIEPGMRVVFYSGGVEQAPQLAISDRGEVIPIGSDAKSLGHFENPVAESWVGREHELLNPAELAGDRDLELILGVQASGAYAVQVPGFLSKKSPTAVGKIISVESTNLIPGAQKLTYGRFETGVPPPGERYLAIRPVAPGQKPDGGSASNMRLFVYTGIVGVLKTSSTGRSTMIVEESRTGVSTGDLLIPYRNLFVQFDARQVARKVAVQTEVIAVEGESLSLAVQGQIVHFRNNGGLAPGDDVDIFMPAGGSVGFEAEDESEVAAIARVIDVTEESAAAMIVQAQREVCVGARTWTHQ